jgi:hypothetical protein
VSVEKYSIQCTERYSSFFLIRRSNASGPRAVFLQFNAAKLPKICETSLREDLVEDLTLILCGVCVRFCGENFYI